MSQSTPITVAYGDGIGPEIMEAVLSIIKEAGAQLSIETIEVGEKVYERGNSTGIPSSAWDALHRTKILLKAPITTPQGGGYKSLNVTMRKSLGLYANVRPCVTYGPVLPSRADMNMVIVRENEEDLYAGIEYKQTDDSVQALKLLTRTGSQRIIRYAFEYARRNGRKKVTCMSKDNIMKFADGMFHKEFDAIAAEYTDITTDHFIIDIGSARIASRPQDFDVIVTLNLYGDIISDIAAEVSGSVGLAGSANIGRDFAMFEAIHGSAPDIAGQNIANPSGLLHGAVMMLVHIGQPEVAEKVHNAWLVALEEGQHTGDIYDANRSKAKLGTKEFADAVIERLGRKPSVFTPVTYGASEPLVIAESGPLPAAKKELIGVDVFLDWKDSPAKLGEALSTLKTDALELKLITCRGLKVWPGELSSANVSDLYQCRFTNEASGKNASHQDIIDLLAKIDGADLDFVHTENLYTFEGLRAYSLAQGE